MDTATAAAAFDTCGLLVLRNVFDPCVRARLHAWCCVLRWVARRCVAWRGVARCGAARRGAVRRRVTSNGVAWRGVRHGAARRGACARVRAHVHTYVPPCASPSLACMPLDAWLATVYFDRLMLGNLRSRILKVRPFTCVRVCAHGQTDGAAIQFLCVAATQARHIQCWPQV